MNRPSVTHPTAMEILSAVAQWVEEVRPQLDGRNAYLARVAANGLAIVGRELAQSQSARDQLVPQLSKLLNQDGDYDTLIDELCRQLRTGALDVSTPDLLSILRADTSAKLAVDQPTYRHERSDTPT
jgi:hypothetical protein